MAGAADAGHWDVMAHGVHEGEFASLLRKLLHYLCYPEPPIYRGRRTRAGGDESWLVEVFIYPQREGDPPHIFRTTHRRSTVAAALQDAARLAAARLCDVHTTVVRGTPFRYYPLRTEDARYDGTRVTELEDDPTLTHQVDLTRSMGTAHVVAQEEITALREHLLARHSEVESLRGQLAECERALAEAKAEAAAFRTQPQQTPAPAPAPAPPPPGSGGLRTRLTARKSVRPPGPQSTLRRDETHRGHRRSRSDSDTDPSEFSGSRSRSQCPDYSPSSPSVGPREE